MIRYNNRTILVTGADGYIGNSLITSLSTIPCRIIALVQNKTEQTVFPSAEAEIVVKEGDIRDEKLWEELLKGVDILFHLAGQTSSSISNENPAFDLATNVLPVVKIIEACQKQCIFPDIIYAGTVTEVGFTTTYPVDESARDLPITAYDINKLASEHYLRFYANQKAGRACTLRLANVYGPGVSSSSPDRGILNKMIRNALEGLPLTAYTGSSFIRDYIYIDDVVTAFILAGEKIEVLTGGYFLIGSGIGIPIKEACSLIRTIVSEKTGQTAEVQLIPPPEKMSRIEFRNFAANSSKFRELTGWTVNTSLPKGLGRTVDFFLRNRVI